MGIEIRGGTYPRVCPSRKIGLKLGGVPTRGYVRPVKSERAFRTPRRARCVFSVFSLMSFPCLVLCLPRAFRTP